ncbi:MAG TPA: 2-oxoglutarate dehydrogenase E1 component [Anaeromyxobacteraceae bacterium]|nr:2-oxoglutarate dehydrogenase E1 component [Anaeromyxobacteraceae bacterium]
MASEPEQRAGSPSFSNLGYVEELYFDYLRDPESVEPAWRGYFQQLAAGEKAPPYEVLRRPDAPFPRRHDGDGRLDGHAAAAARPGAGSGLEALQFKVDRLVQAYREHGHLHARLDPLGLERRDTQAELGLGTFGLSEADLDRPVKDDVTGSGRHTLRELVAHLKETYCRSLGVELAHLHDMDLRSWLEERMERTRNRITLTPDTERFLLRKLTEAELFEQFLGTRFLGAKRFSLEGAEGLVPMLELVIDRAVGHGVKDIAIGMAHRGRLNVLANVVGKPAKQIFGEFRDRTIIGGGGDVKYHLGYQGEKATPEGAPVQVSLAFNPSHLEWISTVVQGKVRARQDRYRDFARSAVLPVIIHGDAAFAGQGIVAECLNMSLLDGYTVGGTIHVVVNNQVGFTTSPRDARSTFYATDVARMLQIPVFHVNGEDLEAIAQTVLLAVDFRQRFHSDAVIDLWCYRKYGHNEGDEPAFTQPVMYRAIQRKPSLRQRYAAELVEKKVVSPDDVEALSASVRRGLEEAYQASAAIAVTPGPPLVRGVKAHYRGGPIAGTSAEIRTVVASELLGQVGKVLATVPPGFNIHPKVAKLLEGRAEMVAGKRPVDWGMGEALAYGTLAWEGVRVRLSGQDVRRGTFSHRHAVLFDQQTGQPYSPLGHLRDGQGAVEVRDSPLSEAGVLGFDYGYSLEMPDGLTIWEAQFGDFVNAAQVIVDQFLSSSEAKWNRLSGLVLLLPHGMEGQGPEHSSARLERFLELSVEDNWQVMNLTTPAQLFHALRRQVLADWRKPLVVMSPKSLLRHPQAVSSLSEFTEGGFKYFIPDELGEPSDVTRVLLCSGKISYELAAARAEQQARQVVIVRIEQLYPLNADHLLGVLSRYGQSREVVWVQEEPRNMGAWEFMNLHLSPLLRGVMDFSCISRPPSASPAAGSTTRHKLEQQGLVNQAIGAPSRPAVAAGG